MAFSLDEEESSPLPGAGDVASAAGSIVDNAPPVSPHVDDISGEHVESSTDGRIVDDQTEKDSAGVAYDPSIHSASKTKTNKGEWKKKRGLGKLGASKKTAKVEAAKSDASAAELAAKAKMAGQVAAMSQFMVCSAIFGPEWKPIVQKLDVPDGLGGQVSVEINEAEEQAGLWGNWFLATGRTDFPPGIALAIGFLSYAGRRFTMPETQRRTSKIKEWAVSKIAAWRVRRADKKASANASTDSRANAERKDNAGNGASSGIPATR